MVEIPCFCETHTFLLIVLSFVCAQVDKTRGGATTMSSKKTKEYKFPDSLEGFGYGFNEEGQLRHLETKEPYQFQVREDDLEYNQKHYEAIGDIITEKIYRMMEQDYGLHRVYLPEDAEENEPKTFFFMSADVMKNANRLMILIHGSGAVRAGQWARKLIINDCLDSGTQLPFIRWAQEHGFGVIVANPNLNRVGDDRVAIRENSSPEEHVETLWTNFVAKTNAKHIAIVAHSYGGVCTLGLAKNHIDEFYQRVKAIALTDSVHCFQHQKTPDSVTQFYKERGRNWASACSLDPLDSPLDAKLDFCPTVSAGTDRHDYTSYSSMQSIFKFIEEEISGSKTKVDSQNNESKSSSAEPLPKSEKEKANESVKKSSDSSADSKSEEATAAETTELGHGDDGNTQEMLSQEQVTEPMSQDTQGPSDVNMDSQEQTVPKSEL